MNLRKGEPGGDRKLRDNDRYAGTSDGGHSPHPVHHAVDHPNTPLKLGFQRNDSGVVVFAAEE